MSYILSHHTEKKISAGKFYPLGATLCEDGINFAVYSENAKEIFLLLFERPDSGPSDIIKIEERTRNIWHVFVHGLKSGALYGYKARGEYNPGRGMRFNEHKFLLDPYARAITSKVVNVDNILLSYDAGSQLKDLSLDTRDNTAFMPRCIVTDNAFDWQGDRPPDIPFEDLIIYEVHLKGFTAHPSSGSGKPGTYLGFIEKIPYLKDLGINAVEFLPLYEFYVDDFLISKGLTNYWGYNTICFFAPESSYSSHGKNPGSQINEFKTLVRELHSAGIEVILDVAYNHSGEGNELGPTISFKGLDNSVYYSLTGPADEPARGYMNYSGCGNSLNLSSPVVMRFVMDSLRYWAEQMHVDGFRFDLATVLGREHGGFQKTASFLDCISQDPVLSRVKLIAEPWDMGTYQAGNFPVDWSEWNGKFRDTMRRFGKGDEGQIRDAGWRITGSADLYGDDGRLAYNSINFITCHDGFTLNDLVSYNYKHNEANLENNADGVNENNSWNWGYEGDIDEPEINNRRKVLVKNYISYLIFSLGTPMILGGDEFMRTQKGNNNAYCQDNHLSWFNWDDVNRHRDILEFYKKAILFRKRYPVLRSRRFLLGRDLDADNIPDISWFNDQLGLPEWNNPGSRTLCYRLDGSDAAPPGAEDYHLFFILNADFNMHDIVLPLLPDNMKWHRVVDTTIQSPGDFLPLGMEKLLMNQISYSANSRATVVLLGKKAGNRE